jgi:hypothetical protein
MRLALSLALIVLAGVAAPDVAAARTDPDPACDAALAVVRDYLKDGSKLVLIGKPFGPDHPLSELETNWRIAPPTSLLQAYRARPAVGVLEGCPDRRAEILGLGVELEAAVWGASSELDAAAQVGVAVVDQTGTMALVQSSMTFRGFGGHCLLSFLRRENGDWRIVDQRPICVV